MKRMAVAVFAFFLAACGYRPFTHVTKAALEGNVAELRRILEQGYKDPDDIQEALVAAARAGCPACLPVLLRHGAQLEYRSGINSWTPLQHAIHKNQLATAKKMVEEGADPNSGLIMAAAYGQSEIVRYLLDHGADPNRVEGGRNALDRALTGVRDIDQWTAGICQTDTVRALLENSPGLKPLRGAPPKGCSEISSMLATRHQAGIQSHP